MPNTYNPYSDIQKVYNAKVAWNKATTDEERKRQNDIATSARKSLEAYGYGDVANQISASGADATAARKIMEKYAPTTTTNTNTNTSIKSPVETNNFKSTEINRENAGLFDKYNESYDYLTKTNPFTTDEAKAILAKYDLSGLQARDNAVAGGGATNGGNIDSYAAANALRQQSALVNQGQMVVLDAHQQKIDNVRGLLSDMGVNIDRVFNQDETAKNNDVARKSEIASVTGVAPDEWVVSNNPYMNDDGTIKDQYKDIDFSAVMAKAKASGNTNAYNAAATARYYKIMSDYGAYGKYDDGNYLVPGEKHTEARRQFDEQNKTALATLQNNLDQIDANKNASKELLEVSNETGLKIDKNGNVVENKSKGDSKDIDSELQSVYEDSSETVQNYIRDVLKPEVIKIQSEGSNVDAQWVMNHLLTNSSKYDLEIKDIKAICEAFGLDSTWVDTYKNNGLFGWGSGVVKK